MDYDRDRQVHYLNCILDLLEILYIDVDPNIRYYQVVRYVDRCGRKG